MLPELFHFGRFALPSYGVIAAIGLLAALYVVRRLAGQHDVDPDKAWSLGIIAMLSALLGAKIFYVINDWSRYSADPRQIFSLETLQAGGVFYGGLLGALAACSAFLLYTRMPVLRTSDVFAPGIALGHAFGRLGCFAAGCCYGRPTDLPWGVKFTNPLAARFAGTPLDVHLHPTQIYEFGIELANFFLLLWLLRRKTFDGQVIGAYVFLYGFARYFIEFFRGDPGRATVLGGFMTATQLISLLLVMAGGALWIRRPPRSEKLRELAQAAP